MNKEECKTQDFSKFNAGTIKVSIIVPVFNTEKYIEKCLNSLVNQTLKEIEIIIVDDGSTDASIKIVEGYAKIDNRIRIFKQENKRQGAARNVGISHAAGEYVGFIDSDDWVDLNYFEKLYNSAKKHNSDLALATNVRIGNGKTKKRLHIKDEILVENLQEKIDLCNLYKDACPTNKIYRLNFIKEKNILFPEGVYCEDKIFTTKAVFYANGIATAPNVYYYYYRNPDSTVNSNKNKKINDIYKNQARKEVLYFLKSQNCNLRDKDFWAIKKEYKIFNFTIWQIKESFRSEKHLLFGLIPIFEKSEVNNE